MNPTGPLESETGPRIPDRVFRLCVIVVPSLLTRPLEQVVEEILRGGADMIQLRAKSLADAQYSAMAMRLRSIVSRHRGLLIVNDSPRVALESGADGVHVGQQDAPPADCRRLLGPQRLVGVSSHDEGQAHRAAREGADYIGVGPVFATRTKAEAGPPIGLAEACRIAERAAVRSLAIGGVRLEHVDALVSGGFHGIAVSDAVLSAPDVEIATAALKAGLRRAVERSAPARADGARRIAPPRDG